jgi:chaperonin cofactor prefoldin
MAYIGTKPTIGNFQICDAISVVNGQAAYTMQVGSVNVIPQSANHMIVSLNGVIQKPGSSFTVSGSTITFASNLATGDVIDFIQILGDVLDLGTPSDATVSLAKLTATGTKDATTFLRGDNTFAAATLADDSITNAKLATGAFAKITGTGTLAGFTSTGIDDDASASILKLLSDNRVRVISDKAGDFVFQIQNSGTSNPYGMAMSFTAAAPDNNSVYFLTANDNAADRFRVWSDGDVVNHDNSYGSISDERIKSNIVNANSQWNDIKGVKVRNYKKNDDIAQYGNNASTELGVIAQELESLNMGGLVKDEILYTSDDKEVINGSKNVGDVKVYKSVKYSILYMKAVKALQEAMERIETLEAKVTALENA